jgi:uncharacterized protein with NRDE domain
MSNTIILEIKGKKEFIFLHGNKKSTQDFIEWFNKQENPSYKGDYHILICSKDYINYIETAIFCGLRPSRVENFL